MKSQPKTPLGKKPSEVTCTYWLHAERKSGTYPEATENRGKWLVFVPALQIDEVWANIKLATEEGRLGSSAKIATARPKNLSLNLDSPLIFMRSGEV